MSACGSSTVVSAPFHTWTSPQGAIIQAGRALHKPTNIALEVSDCWITASAAGVTFTQTLLRQPRAVLLNRHTAEQQTPRPRYILPVPTTTPVTLFLPPCAHMKYIKYLPAGLPLRSEAPEHPESSFKVHHFLICHL